MDPLAVTEADLNGQGRQADSGDITFDNYKGIFSGDAFSSALINSIGIGLITTVIAVVVGGMAAYAVARLAFPVSGYWSASRC